MLNNDVLGNRIAAILEENLPDAETVREIIDLLVAYGYWEAAPDGEKCIVRTELIGNIKLDSVPIYKKGAIFGK